MTSQDGSKAYATAIWIDPAHLPGMAGAIAEKTACGCSFRQHNPSRIKILADQWNSAQGQAGSKGKMMSEIVTAGILVIGDEILSGRTKDKNIGFIAEYLTNIGIDLKEVRVVADEEPEIIAALDALRHRYSYVFTTGGIGPTHDDITADSVAKAFGVGIDHHPDVVARFRERWGEADLNEARLRMARIPDGAELIQSATILAPGFKIGNVIVMAGVPTIMQAMMDIVAPKLKSGVRMLSESVRANAREGDIGGPLRAIAEAHPDTIIGSYPFTDDEKKPNTNLVVRSRDPEKLAAAMNAVKEMLAGLNVSR
jgi:molybdenum cofactor synthesis domain-containing protein